jgi:hypothetical protein
MKKKKLGRPEQDLASWRPRWSNDVISLIRELKKLPIKQQKLALSKVLSNKMNELEDVLEEKGGTQERTLTGYAKSPEDLLERRGIDTTFWKITRSKIKENQWDVHGKTTSDEWIKATNYQKLIEVTVEPRFKIEDDERFKQEFLEDMSREIRSVDEFKNISILNEDKYDKWMLELNLWDVHMGRFIWDEEKSEVNYNTDIACERYLNTIITLTEEAENVVGPLEQIVIPIGNDFFTSDKDIPFSSTTHGTPQHLDHMWQHIYRKGRTALIDAINMLAQRAPVYIYNIPGNHDQQKSFFLGDAVELYFKNHPTVHVNNHSRETKYHRYGNSLIGYHHGRYKSGEAFKRLATTMQDQMPQDWAETKFHEWHMGDKHKQEQWRLRDEIDYQGLVFKHMRSLASIDDWETSMLYKRQIGGQAYLWNWEKGKTFIIYDNILEG